ncbi:MAG: tetratricopeptide repeat protein, partial [Gammaproteobacteria bacterium]|nr:tetratricopeptide repeat protein [Gammaproteobacteria bacterium]
GVAHYVARDYASAEAVFRQLLEISPDLALTQSWLGQSLLGLGKPEEALAAYQREIDPMFRAHGLAKAYFILGRSKEADEQLAELIRIGVPGAYYQIAQVQAVRGEREAAMTALENAWEVRDPGISYLRVDQFFDSLRDQPRVKAILEHIGAARD